MIHFTRFMSSVTLATILFISLLAMSCGGGGGGTEPTTGPTTTPTVGPTTGPTTPVKAQVLKYALHSIPGSPSSNSVRWMADEFVRRSNGRIKIDYYYLESLVPQRETLNAVGTGVADLAFTPTQFTPGRIALLSMTELPALTLDPWSGMHAMYDLMGMPDAIGLVPDFDKELADNNVVIFELHGTPTSNLQSVKPIRSLADLKGLKIIASGGQDQQLLLKLGAVPLSVPTLESYTMLQRGTAEAYLGNPNPVNVYKIFEVAKYWYTLSLGGRASSPQTMNRDIYNNLAPDLRQLIRNIRDNEQPTAQLDIYIGTGVRPGWEIVKPLMLEINEISPEDQAEVVRLAKEGVWKDWIKQVNEKGSNGQAILDKYLELVDKYAKQSPWGPDKPW